MNAQQIMDAWKPQKTNVDAGVELWNGKAAHFGSRSLPTPDDSIAMRLIQQKNMVKPGDRVLDVGCGGGRFCFALENLGVNAVGLDFAPGMIEQCRKRADELKASSQFSVCDWNGINIDDMGWSRQFDLVLANMTPAVASADTFLKLSKASRNWCLMVKPTRRTNTVLDALNRIVGAQVETQVLNETVAYAFDLLWFNGMKPILDYEDQVWDYTQPVEAAVKEYTARIASVNDLTECQKQAIRDYLESIAIDGQVHETTHTLIVAMCWQV